MLVNLDVLIKSGMQEGDLVFGVVAAIEEEKDPRCLLLAFRIIQLLGRLYPDPDGPIASCADELFDVVSRYFPISFNPVSILWWKPINGSRRYCNVVQIVSFLPVITCYHAIVNPFVCASDSASFFDASSIIATRFSGLHNKGRSGNCT